MFRTSAFPDYGLQPLTANNPQNRYDYDVVVIGAGHAGTEAAAAAARL
ncbi:FAD-dependent oxidoreductase, partial [Rhodopirellula bahusiensis]